ncbi:MAG: hypothetical protein C7N36_21560 [Bacteroidetes bacterium]|nr:MAG: hypothetical protein C7N36_21560 [Bacteroidota bacterium]
MYVPGYEYYKNKTANPLYIPAVGTSISPYFGYSPEAKFELTRMIKRTFPDAIRYYLTFEINCELYYGGNYIRGEYFGTLEDGVLETIIELPL